MQQLFVTGTPVLPEAAVAVARKLNGRHYTPTDLARFLAKQTSAACPLGTLTVLDPACGDGELLLAFAAEAAATGRSDVRLFGVDTDPAAVSAASARLAAEGVPTVLAHADFLDAWPPPGFPSKVDVIISNPPYVRTQALGADRAQALARQFGLSGRVDLYHAFVAAISERLADDGVMGLLCSNRFLTTKGGLSTRSLLAERFAVRELWDLGDTKLFEAAVLPAIVVAARRGAGVAADPTFVSIYETQADGPATTAGSLLEAVHHDGVVDVYPKRFRVEHGVLATQDPRLPWVVTSPRGSRWLRQVRSRAAGRLGDLGPLRVGIKTTADKVFIRSDWDFLPPEQRPESPLLRPLLTHHRSARWQLTDAKSDRRWVLYPHQVVDGRREPIDLAAYPRAAAYLAEHRDRLEGRKYVREAGREWYEIWVPQDPTRWAPPKLVWPDISETPRFALDRSGAVVNGDCYWLSCGGQADEAVALALAVANSTFALDFYDMSYGNRLYSGRRRFITQYLQDLPLPEVSGADARHVAGLVDRLCAPGGGPAGAEGELDRIVATLFGLEEPTG